MPGKMMLIAALALGACARDHYAGIDLLPGGATPELQRLAERAQSGDKQAQFELGMHYEEGLGVPVDLKRAAGLYRQAATDSGGTIWIYSPKVGNSPGRVMPVDTGPRRPGIKGAKARLLQLTSADRR